MDEAGTLAAIVLLLTILFSFWLNSDPREGISFLFWETYHWLKGTDKET